MTVFNLKIIALILMTVDHVGKFFSATPVFMRWIGRLAAPVFFFCSVKGAVHTSDRKAYIKRLYLMSLLMMLLNRLIPFALDGYGIQLTPVSNNIFSSILQGVIVVNILENTKQDTEKRRSMIAKYCLYQAAVTIITLIVSAFDFELVDEILVGTVLGCIFTTEGSVLLTGVMLLYYKFRDSKKKLAIAYVIYCIVYGVITVCQIPQRVVSASSGLSQTFGNVVSIPLQLLGFETFFSAGTFTNSLLQINYQWMMILALPLLLSYNGKKGRGMKKLFYAYYPIHIYTLSIIASVLNF